MDTLLISPTVERKVDKRPFLSWTKKSMPSSLFNKAKHSEEWHRGVEATAGVLHPSDSKFPYEFLRNHTDVYLRKKGKINQADIDNRLATLINAHPARDIAVAAAAHAMSAKSLRSLLHAEINVAQGSYLGLETWLQCMIAAYQGNPASVTDLEAKWAHMLLPYASHGDRAAGWYLKGVSRALRKCNVSNMGVLPEFWALITRAITDYSTQLEGFRLKGQWVAAHQATTWMVELERALPAVAPQGHLLLEHIFDRQFPSWRLWAEWKPDIPRITRLATHDSVRLATIPDIVALEGPDVFARSQSTLREGLISQYGPEKPWVLFGRLVVEVPDRTKEGLRATLRRLAKGLESIPAVKAPDAGSETMFALFRDLTVTQPITSKGLDLFEATIKIPYTQENDIFNTVRNISIERYGLGGQHILTLQRLIGSFDGPEAEDLRTLLVHPWLVEGVEKCIKECQTAVMTHIEMSLPWPHLATELHRFLTTITGSETIYPLLKADGKLLLDTLPSAEQMANIVEMYAAAQAQRPKPSKTDPPQTAKADDAETEPSTKRDSKQPDPPSEPKKLRHPLEPAIEAFCIRRLLQPGQIEKSTQRLMNGIFHVWLQTSKPQVDSDRRALTILVMKNAAENIELICECLADIATGKQFVEQPNFAKSLVAVVTKTEENLEQAIVECTKLLASKPVEAACWKDLLYTWLERENKASTAPIDHSLKIMKASEWIVFMGQLKSLFPPPAPNPEERPRPSILDPHLLDWVSQVCQFTTTLTRLENALGDHDAASLILNCGAGFWSRSSLKILECLKEAQGKPVEALMHKVVGKLSAQTQNTWEVRDCLVELRTATPEALQMCERIWDAKHGSMDIPGLPAPVQVEKAPILSKRGFMGVAASLRPSTSHSSSANQRSMSVSTSDAAPVPTVKVTVPSAVAEVMVAGWLQDDSKLKTDKSAIEKLARVLSLEVHAHDIPAATLQKATEFWEGIEKEIMKEVERLEMLQKALKAKDPKGTALLLQELGVQDNSLLDEEILSLPAGVMDVVERVGDSEVEIGFPLTAYTELQRSAMGIPKNSKALLLRLTIDHNGKVPPSFCVHFNNDANLDTVEHTPWICSQESRAPHENFCKATETAFSWQLNRILHTQLKTGTVRIVDVHRFVKQQMGELGQSCISCGTSHNAANAQLRRSTPCDLVSCAQLWYQLPLNVRIPEIRTDTFAVDMMLTSVYAAAMTNRTELLPGCPIRGNELIKTILNSLPNLTTLSHAVNLSAVLKTYHKDAEKLISWACVHFRGYLTTAKGVCKIPNLPSGTHQFVLASAKPKMESAFAAKAKSGGKNIVLFHGTSMDRLPAILNQGLKIFSGTALQRTGAAHGKGIYMAEEPATSLTYSPTSLSWRNSGLANMRLLFGCEVLNGGRSVSPGIHVITDESTVMMRYIFFLTNSASAPTANTITPAMLIGMSALRTGTV